MTAQDSSIMSALARTETTISRILAAGGTTGASIAVARGGKLLHESYFGYKDVEHRIKPDKSTIYGIASITKSFSAAAIGILVHEGKLDWTTPISTILPEFHSSNAEVTEKATIVDMLSHQSGLTNSSEWWYGADGEILVDPDEEMLYINNLAKVHDLRTKFLYNNWGYAVVGRIIERLSGMSYQNFVKTRLLEPLGMRSTTADGHEFMDSTDLANPYAVFDDRSVCHLDQPAVCDGTIMTAAQGLRSTAPDMLKWGAALLKAAAYEEINDAQPSLDSPLRYASKLLTGHVSRKESAHEKSYTLGLYRNELPTQFEGLGCNSMFVDQMPTIHPREDGTIVLTHGGSMAGYHTFLTLIPSLDIVIVVLTNSIALADPAGWINQYLIETIIDSPIRNDYVALAQKAAQGHVASYSKIIEELENQLEPHDRPPKLMSAYMGVYKDQKRPFYISIEAGGWSPLRVVFQLRASQSWALDHYEGDTFQFFDLRDKHVQRALFTFGSPDEFKIFFESDENGDIVSLLWPMDPNLPNDVQRFYKIDVEGK